MTTTVLNTKNGEVENKIPDASDLVKKTDYNAKTSDTEAKYFTACNHTKFTCDILETKIKEKGFVDKFRISDIVKNSELNRKLAILATKAELKAEKGKTVKLHAIDSSYFCGKSHFEDDGMQNYLVLWSVYRYFQKNC